MHDIFASFDRAELMEDPYPHVVVNDALPAEIADTLIAEMPPLDILMQRGWSGSPFRFPLPSPTAIADTRISPRWKAALQSCVAASQILLDRSVALLGAHMQRTYPTFAADFGALQDLRAVPRGEHKQSRGLVGMDAQLVANGPDPDGGSIVRGPHIDQPDKLISALLYLRDRDDDSEGGELELYEPLSGVPLFFDAGNGVPASAVRVARRYPYRHNLMIVPVNSPRALHGVSPRGHSLRPRYHLHFVGEMAAPLFQVTRAS
jgi:hypothetical protein